jgi:hypothetical protein
MRPAHSACLLQLKITEDIGHHGDIITMAQQPVIGYTKFVHKAPGTGHALNSSYRLLRWFWTHDACRTLKTKCNPSARLLALENNPVRRGIGGKSPSQCMCNTATAKPSQHTKNRQILNHLVAGHVIICMHAPFPVLLQRVNVQWNTALHAGTVAPDPPVLAQHALLHPEAHDLEASASHPP